MTRLRLVPNPDAPKEPLTFADVYREHFDFVWRVLARLGVPDRDLADAAQDVFMVVYKKLPDFNGECRCTTWLYGICFRVASTRRRAAPARRELLDEPPLQAVGERSDDLAAATAHYRRLLREAMDRMPLEQRAVFAFYELDGMTGLEIAEELGVPEATVHSRLRLARQVFRQFVERLSVSEAFKENAKRGAP